MRPRGAFVLVAVGAVASATVAFAPATSSVASEGVNGSPPLPRFVEALPVPPVIHPDDGGTVALDEVNGTNRFSPALPATPTFGYVPAGATPVAGGTYLGPTIEVRRGQPVRLSVTSDLHTHPLAAYIDSSLEGVSPLDATAPRTSTHLHGGHTPPGSDGGPTATFRRAGIDGTDFANGSGTATYTYPDDQEATELWYHDHALGITRLNVEAGLAGLYLVRDTFDTGAANPLGLPFGAYEVPLVLQDRSFNADGTFAYPVGPFVGSAAPDYPQQWAPESFGDVATVNGAAWPTLSVDRAIYRFRLLNGSNARFYRLSWRSPAGRPVDVAAWQIGSEGGLFDAPVRVDSLLVAPGERADLLVDFRHLPRGTRVTLTNDAPAPYPGGSMAPGRGGVPLRQIMQFAATGNAPSTGAPAQVPNRLRGGEGRPPMLPALTPSSRRSVLLNEILDPATGDPTEVLINNLGFHEHASDGSLVIPRQSDVAEVHLNSVEEWDIVNTTADTHPIHLHLTQFRVLGRQGFDVERYLEDNYPGLPSPAVSDAGPWPVADADSYLVPGTATAPGPTEMGWKDTVQAPPGQVTRIVVPFGGTAAGVPAPFTGDALEATQHFVGDYVFHCHILEHEDNDMMQPYRVVP